VTDGTAIALKRILAVCDLSVAGTNAAWRAGLLARDHGAWLRLLHVGRASSSVARGKAALDALAWELQERLKIAVLAQSVRGGLRHEVAAAASEADLLVVRSAQAHPLRDWLAGSHPERLVEACRRPALVVRRPATVGYRRVLACVDEGDDASGTMAAATALTRAPAPSVVFDRSADQLLARERAILADLVVIGRPPRNTPIWWAPRTHSRLVLAHALADVLVLPALPSDPLPSASPVDIALS
jgi:nucleotide-binding universal stress UspA family protein